MKIVLIHNLLEPFARGGAERVVEMQAEGLRALGHKVYFITTKPFGSRLKDSVDKYRISSLYHSLKSWPLIIKIIWHFGEFINVIKYFKIKKLLDDLNPDLIISHNMLGLGWISLGAINKYKHIHLLHDVQLFYPSGLIYFGQEAKAQSIFSKTFSFMTKFIINSPDIIVSPSNWLLNEHLDRGFFPKSKKLVSLNPVANVKIEKIEKRDAIYRFLYIGHQSRAKGFDLLLKAWKEIISKTDAVELHIVGKFGDLEAKDIKGIFYHGYLPYEKLTGLINSADCLVSPSMVYENSPMAITDATLFNKRVIASRIGGSVDFEIFDNVVLFTPGDVKELTDLMIDAIKKPSITIEDNSLLTPVQYCTKILSAL